MLNIPQVDGSLLSSPTTMIAVVVIIIGALFAFVALPHVRDKASQHIETPKEFFYGDKKAPESAEDGEAQEGDEPVSGAEFRREIEDFDLSIFEEE